MEAERVAKKLAEQEAFEAQMAKQAAEAAAIAEQEGRLQAQQVAEAERDARLIAEQQATHNRQEAERRAYILSTRYEQTQQQTRNTMKQLVEQSKKDREVERERVFKELDEKEKLVIQFAQMEVYYERQLRMAAQREAAVARMRENSRWNLLWRICGILEKQQWNFYLLLQIIAQIMKKSKA
eukprot:TRINITY_DN1212_c0_g1_i12.p1 TRINITY_DN1212_c0_g1~~TRINITY_DN1212_c0_g1_i12.p1  ORF type:complete len:202 (-),score=44.00 TRINITY_DN1212_c0_g1_i12:274-819(-)